MQLYLENENLKVTINYFGAELSSIQKKSTGTEYLWNADPAYWNRTSPVLFPIVGSLKGKEFQYGGNTYPMGQHGFARDMEFSLLSATETECWLELSSNEETLAKYPFAFRLKIGYRLEDEKLTVIWRVINEDEKTMHFSIGGHPAFMCPLEQHGQQTDYFISFDTKEPITYGLLNTDGLLATEETLTTEDGFLPITADLFDRDALIIEHDQAKRVSLCTPNKVPYLTVTFDSPLFGVWSPAGKHAPFICIEPWYGRCDRFDFNGTLAEREYSNTLNPQEVFERSYQIEIG